MVYAVFNYNAQNSDELTFADGDCLQVLRKGDEHEKDWWWTRLGHSEGYIPRNLLGVNISFPRCTVTLITQGKSRKRYI